MSTLPIPHDAAAAIVITNGSTGAATMNSHPTTTMPSTPMAMPATCQRVGSSRSTRAAIVTVNTVWICSTSDANPAGIPRFIAV